MLEVFVCILNKHHKMTPDGGVWPGGGGGEWDSNGRRIGRMWSWKAP